MPECIARKEDGTLCRAPAYTIDPKRGGMVCALHAPADASLKHVTEGRHVYMPDRMPIAAALHGAISNVDSGGRQLQRIAEGLAEMGFSPDERPLSAVLSAIDHLANAHADAADALRVLEE